MSRIIIKGDDLTRIVCINTELENIVSYEDFCSDYSIFYDIRKTIEKALEEKNKHGSTGYRGYLLNQESPFDINMNNKINKINILMQYDIIEEYKNYKVYDKFIFRQGEGKHEISNDEGFLIDLLKCLLSNNGFIYNSNRTRDNGIKNPDIIFNKDEIIELMALEYDNNRDWEDYMNGLKKKIGYKEALIRNNIISYIVFYNLITQKNIYITSQGEDIDIISEDQLKENLQYNTMIRLLTGKNNTINISKKNSNLIDNIRKGLINNKSDLSLMIKDLEEMVTKTGTLQAIIEFQNNKPMHMTGKFKTNDMEKYEELKEYTADYGHITHQNHGGKKRIIIGEKQFKYKPNKDGKGKDNL